MEHQLGVAALIFIAILISLMSICLYQLAFGLNYGCMRFYNIWVSKVADDEFDQWLDELFSDEQAERDSFSVQGGGHYVWIANHYYGFKFDGYQSEQLSLFQKRRFFKRFKEEKRSIFESRVVIQGKPRHFYNALKDIESKVKELTKAN